MDAETTADAPTWRELIKNANEMVEGARAARNKVWQEARDAGLTLAQIGDVAGVSPSAVGSVTTDPKKSVDLDMPVGGDA